MACKALQECYETRKEIKSYVLWESIRRIEQKSANGTVCLGSELDIRTVQQRCGEWMSGERWSEDAKAWLHDLDDMMGKRVNFTNCAELVEAINLQCSFDSATVRQFTSDIKASRGDYTIAFWVKPVGYTSKMDDGIFYPHISFASSISPPQQQISIARYSTGLSGEVRSRSKCVEHLWENVEIRKVKSAPIAPLLDKGRGMGNS